jgi:hypothetical protein
MGVRVLIDLPLRVGTCRGAPDARNKREVALPARRFAAEPRDPRRDPS